MRRLTVYLRRGLFVVGVVLLVWWPVSYLVMIWISLPLPFVGISIGSSYGQFNFTLTYGLEPIELGAAVTAGRGFLVEELSSPVRPTLDIFEDATDGYYTVFIPLWLLAAACLASPVTSYFLYRRREGRGFEVETVEGMKEEG